MKLVKISDFLKFIQDQIRFKIYKPVLGLGKSGIGKTESVKELTEEMGIGFRELRLVTLTETDMLGIPMINEHKRTDWASNNLLPLVERDGETGILVLDEITSASDTVRAAAYQLLDSKRSLGNYTLPPKWLVVALGNGPEDGGVFKGMEVAFLNRCAGMRIDYDLGVWKKWAVGKGVHPAVIGFLSFTPDALHVYDPNSEEAQIIPSPRSWTALSDLLNSAEREYSDKLIPKDSIDIYAAVNVGREMAAKFGAFYNYSKETVSISDILDGKASTSIRNIPLEVRHLIIQGLVKEIAQILKMGRLPGSGIGARDLFAKGGVDRVANATTWILAVGSNGMLDMAIMAMTDLGANVKDYVDLALMDSYFATKCPKLMDFCEKNGKLLAPK